MADESLASHAAQRIAADIELLAALHDRELDFPMLTYLLNTGFPESLALRLESGMGREAVAEMRACLDALERNCTPEVLDALAADYAAIYLTHAFGASPEESVWLDEERLTRQIPMFEVRAWMFRHGLAVSNWRIRSDDHLVHQLLFIGHLFRQSSEKGRAVSEEAAEFMDRHILRWVERFARRVAMRSPSPFYAALAMLTASYLNELRELIALIVGKPRPQPEPEKKPIRNRTGTPYHEPPPSHLPGTALSL